MDRSIDYVIAVAECKSISQAAEMLYISQPSLSRYLSNLENELGCRLFTRSKSGMKLTPEGRTFYSYVSAGCAQFFKGESDLKDRLSLEKGEIDIEGRTDSLVYSAGGGTKSGGSFWAKLFK